MTLLLWFVYALSAATTSSTHYNASIHYNAAALAAAAARQVSQEAKVAVSVMPLLVLVQLAFFRYYWCCRSC